MSAQKRNKARLLVVEDDPGLQNQLKWCFEDYKVDIAGDRESAVEIVKSTEPPVVTIHLVYKPPPLTPGSAIV